MFEYKSEVIKLPFKIFKSVVNEEAIANIDEYINKKSSEGWTLVTYTFIGVSDNGMHNSILITFKREK